MITHSLLSIISAEIFYKFTCIDSITLLSPAKLRLKTKNNKIKIVDVSDVSINNWDVIYKEVEKLEKDIQFDSDIEKLLKEDV